MTTKKILIMGLGVEANEEGLRTWLGSFGPVEHVEIVRDGSAEEPFALVEMNIGHGEATYMVARLTNYWHEGNVLNARLLQH